MRIYNNLMSMSACGFMNRAMNRKMDSLEKLSSGRSINSAADNAAGLAISEKIRAQINGLGRAEKNAQDGISMLQTAEGALEETSEILQRMRTLSIQSFNDALSQDDRVKIQLEVDELASEITRISNAVEFNGKKLLNGGLTSDTQNGSDINLQIGSGAEQIMSFGIKALDAHSLGVDRRLAEVTVEKGDGDVVGAEVVGNSGVVVDGNVVSVTTEVLEAGGAQKNGVKIYSFYPSSMENIYINDELVFMTKVRNLSSVSTYYNPQAPGLGQQLADAFQNATYLVDEYTTADLKDKYLISWDADHLVIDTIETGSSSEINFDGSPSDTLAMLGFDTTTVFGTDESYTATFSDGIREDSIVTVAADATSAIGTGDFAGIGVSLDGSIGNGTSTITLDIESGTAAIIDDDGTVNDAVANGGIDVSTGSSARVAIATIDEAIDTVSGEKSKIGAMHNRLEHVVNNLLTASENLTSSESRIRDADMAKEMMEFTKMEILVNVTQAIMSQANKNQEEVLSLLR
ncbi:flagellin [Dethiosulfatibacter aminovorans DSM 17477]|uniref:Flagellin n=1 Tax=Dethiosulfatibacter aminovorans DSM 17477 TaxID=1121476 RepID=A0A1M6KP79_9FIRM|nr:flagellin [Dethiosulfatibacter aminovorans]SHJ60749.1 flagellin [Dethiosulfatibacter aminovorans DSM 17477]